MKLILLAHQDDEIFVLPYLLGEDKKLLVYLTNGVSIEKDSLVLEKRIEEARVTFEKHIANLNSEVIWWGVRNMVPEGELHKFVNASLVADIQKIIKSSKWKFSEVVTTAFEGAHQDHDSAAVIARRIAKEEKLELNEISTYPQWHSQFYSFRMLSPKFPDKVITIKRIKVIMLAFKLMWSYKTQRRTWVGLGLPLLWAYLFLPYRTCRSLEVGLINPCLYEFRKRRKQSEVLRSLAAIIDVEGP